MEEKASVSEHCCSLKSHTRIWIQLFIFKMISGFQSEMSGVNDGQYIYHFVKEQLFNDTIQNGTVSSGINTTSQNGNCESKNMSSSDDRAQSEATSINQYSEMISSGISVIIMILLGPLTDKIGRKPILIWNVTMMLIGMSIRMVVVYNSLNVYLVLVTSVFNGLSGTHYTYDLASSGIMADTTTKDQQRSFIMIMYNSANNIGFFFAQITTGYLIHYFGYIPQYFICVSFLLFLDLSIIIFLREKKRTALDKNEKLCSISMKSQIWSILTDKEIGNRKHIFSWMSVFIISMFSVTAYIPIRNLYQLGSPFCWSSERIGWYGASYTIIQGIFGPLVIAILQRCFADEIVLQFGCVSAIICFMIYGFASKTWMLYLVVGVGVIRYSPLTIIKAILSRKVHSDKQGVLFSNMALIDSIVRVGGVAAFSVVYKNTRPIYKGLVFLVMGGITLVSSLMAVFFTSFYGIDPIQRRRYSELDPQTEKTEDNNSNNYPNTIQYSFE